MQTFQRREPRGEWEVLSLPLPVLLAARFASPLVSRRWNACMQASARAYCNTVEYRQTLYGTSLYDCVIEETVSCHTVCVLFLEFHAHPREMFIIITAPRL